MGTNAELKNCARNTCDGDKLLQKTAQLLQKTAHTSNIPTKDGAYEIGHEGRVEELRQEHL